MEEKIEPYLGMQVLYFYQPGAISENNGDPIALAFVVGRPHNSSYVDLFVMNNNPSSGRFRGSVYKATQLEDVVLYGGKYMFIDDALKFGIKLNERNDLRYLLDAYNQEKANKK